MQEIEVLLVIAEAEADAYEQQMLSIDYMEAQMLNSPNVYEPPITHHFTEGLYCREMFAQKDSILVSKIHKTQHPFFVLKGKLAVLEDGKVKVVEAGTMGMTQPGTRRVAYILEDCVWVTAHANPDNENVEQIEERIIQRRENVYLQEQNATQSIDNLCHGWSSGLQEQEQS